MKQVSGDMCPVSVSGIARHLTPGTLDHFGGLMTERIYNFSAGPAILPLPVLAQAQRELVSLPGIGMSVMEISHRSEPFDEILQGADNGIRELMGVPDDYHVLFLQ